MKRYEKVDVPEAQLEELVRRHCGEIEEDLTYLDHQLRTAGGRLDVLLVDSGKALVVAELKVIPDDGMLMQGLDYFDYVTTNIEAISRLYRNHKIDPSQKVRLLLIAPDFSSALINRAKWLDLRISLFSYTCLKFDGDEDIVPIFSERTIPEPPSVIDISRIEDHLRYIIDDSVRGKVVELFDEVKSWRPGGILLDSIKYSISMKVGNRVFAYFSARRQHFVIGTFTAEDQWKDFSIKTAADLDSVKLLMRSAMERRIRFSA